MLNSDTAKLDHILSMGNSSGDHHGLGYTRECFSTKAVFGKGISPPKSCPQSGMNSEPNPPRRKSKRFVPACHYCHLLGHIRPGCFKYLNTLKRGMLFNPPNFA